jgi:hypothetical protein
LRRPAMDNLARRDLLLGAAAAWAQQVWARIATQFTAAIVVAVGCECVVGVVEM